MASRRHRRCQGSNNAGRGRRGGKPTPCLSPQSRAPPPPPPHNPRQYCRAYVRTPCVAMHDAQTSVRHASPPPVANFSGQAREKEKRGTFTLVEGRRRGKKIYCFIPPLLFARKIVFGATTATPPTAVRELMREKYSSDALLPLKRSLHERERKCQGGISYCHFEYF